MDYLKSEKLYELLKTLKYNIPQSTTPHSYQYLFAIPDVSTFFEWFIANINENCYLSKLEIEKFKHKIEKNQIIWDIDKLKTLCYMNEAKKSNDYKDLFDYQDTDDPLQIQNDINELQDEINDLEDYLKKRLLNKQQLLNEYQNHNKGHARRIKEQLDTNSNQQQTQLKNLSKKFNQTITNVHSRINYNGNKQLQSIDNCKMVLDSYLNNEKEYLKLMKTCVKKYFSTIGISKDDDRRDLLYLKGFNEREIQFYENYFKLIENKYPKLILEWLKAKNKVENMSCILKSIEKVDLKFIASIIQKNIIDDELHILTKNRQTLQNSMFQMDQTLVKNIKILTKVKLANLLQSDMEFKEIRFENYINKQDRIMDFLVTQKSRLDFLNKIQELKLNDIEMLKQTFETVKISLRNTSNNSSLMSTTCSSFNSFLTSKNIGKAVKMNPSDCFLRIINQTLITSLNAFNSNMLNAPVSIKLADNIRNLKQLTKKVEQESLENEAQNNKFLRDTIKILELTIEYLYGSKNDLSQLELGVRSLIELREYLLNEQQNLNQLFSNSIITKYNQKKSFIEHNPLQKLKQNLFVDFYLNPNKLEKNLSSMLNLA